MTFHPVKHVEEVFEMALVKWVQPEKRDTVPQTRNTKKPKK
jgi:hypothetical protein